MSGTDLTQYIPLPHSQAHPKLSALQQRRSLVSREYAPTPGKWYENKDEEETFRVLSVDEDDELVEIEYEDGEIEELDLDTWHELDLELTDVPEGWSDSAAETTMTTRTKTSTTMKTKTMTTMMTTTTTI